MFTQIIPIVKDSNISIQEIIDSWDIDTDPETNFKLFCVTLGAKLKWQEKKKTDIPQLLKDDLKKYGKYVKNKRLLEDDDFASKYLQQMIDANPRLPEGIDKVYKQYADSYKLAGNPDDIKSGPTILTPDGRIDSTKNFPKFMKNRNGDRIFTYNRQFNQWEWINFDCYKKQFKIFKRACKDKKAVVKDENNEEHEFNGNMWYSIAINQIDDDGEILDGFCFGSLQIFGYMMVGFVYYFKNKTDRDNAYKYLTKK